MEQSPSWAAEGFSASQEIPRILLKPKVHYRDYKSLPPVTILSQLDLVHLNIILPSTPGFWVSYKAEIWRLDEMKDFL